jgi:hypothetical protein
MQHMQQTLCQALTRDDLLNLSFRFLDFGIIKYTSKSCFPRDNFWAKKLTRKFHIFRLFLKNDNVSSSVSVSCLLAIFYISVRNRQIFSHLRFNVFYILEIPTLLTKPARLVNVHEDLRVKLTLDSRRKSQTRATSPAAESRSDPEC